jgi:hypothetical protein
MGADLQDFGPVPGLDEHGAAIRREFGPDTGRSAAG